MNLKNVMRWLAIFVFTLNVNAQWKSSMNGIYVDSTKVGVGMIPNSRFSVEEHDSLNYGGSSLISTFARRFLANRVSFNIYGFPSSSQAKSHVITSYSIHYTKLYEVFSLSIQPLSITWAISATSRLMVISSHRAMCQIIQAIE